MAGSIWGTLFRAATWGESHGEAVGVVVDGCPAGLPLSEDLLQPFLDRRRPGRSVYATGRKESDRVRILSGVFEGRTTGTPISMLVENEDHHSADYSENALYYRPGHADETYDLKYGFRDYRGGGRSSGRETVGRVAAGGVASLLLSTLGISIRACSASIGPVSCDLSRFDEAHLKESELCMPDADAEREAAAYLDKCRAGQTSAGGSVLCEVFHMPPGLGEPVFDKLSAQLGKAMFSIGAVKAVEIGDGIASSLMQGHENNDQFITGPDGHSVRVSEHAGGIYGGISDGSDLRFTVHFKPTPSIAREQSALFCDGTAGPVRIRGRHDPVIVPRAVVVVESMTALVLADLLLQNMSSTMDGLLRYYRG